MLWKYNLPVYVNIQMRPIETILGMKGMIIEENYGLA
jgi:hypothetical protein